MPNIEKHYITFEYELYHCNGNFIESSRDKAPIQIETGAGATFPRLEMELVMLGVGEKKRIFLSHTEAYGPVSSENFREFPLDAIPEETRKIGRKVAALSRDGHEELVSVVDIHDNRVVLDFNHPLAGKDLYFDVTILSKTPLA